ncbi:hypothetical protein [Candidatus Nanosynbacter featherlites]|uniref:Uncharacterized protein n=1 Tax=Candidatus Nanosynbacter featherlites TaxID=2572088 RepID=A0A4V1GDJ3_9BACT|nr:hypothetical protein [Candidatus Nanosynbacter featherlites]QCT41986.1 hypothetical protein FBF37_00675 [Candidatus Nanosynbacter featherlites]
MKQINRQRGSVMTFTVVGVVLAILALGLLYTARQQDNNAVVPVATDNNSQKQELAQKDEKADQNKSETAKPNTTTNTQSNNSQKQEQPKNQSTGNAQKPSATQQPAPTTSTGPATPTAPAAATNGSSTANLPTTGPADHIGELLVVGVIPGMAVAYFRSRKVV